ncbi:MAG: hypothetical protein AMXMBFR37_07450 [Steroidobacteraceae bacterium]|jgi:integrase
MACHPEINMATIRARRQTDGTLRYTAIVRIRRTGKVVHQEAKTFSQRGPANTWAKHREVELENPTNLALAKHGAPSLGSLIRWYIDTFKSISGWQRTKQTSLEFLEKHSISQSSSLELSTAKLIAHVQQRRADGAGPATVANDLIWIGVVLRAAKSVTQLPVRPEIAQEARTACRELRLTKRARKRDRRPTTEELQKLDEYFTHRDKRADLPMRDILHFAIHSARRQAEICRVEWEDNDDVSRSGVVRDAKHPREKQGNHRRFKYTQEAWDIVQRQPRTHPCIFPFNPKSVGAAFTRACHILGIDDLRFHDLRHEGTSRLFERGYQIHEVAQFTLHDSWNELKRYANLRPENLREIGAPDSAPSTESPIHAVVSMGVIPAGRAARQ